MTGTFHHRQERLRREAEELRDRLLPKWQNLVLQRFVVERNSGWYTLLNQLAAQTPLGRIAEPADITDIAAFLASDDSRWVTGQMIHAGGGTF